jgi:hypothetical protein
VNVGNGEGEDSENGFSLPPMRRWVRLSRFLRQSSKTKVDTDSREEGHRLHEPDGPAAWRAKRVSAATFKTTVLRAMAGVVVWPLVTGGIGFMPCGGAADGQWMRGRVNPGSRPTAGIGSFVTETASSGR